MKRIETLAQPTPTPIVPTTPALSSARALTAFSFNASTTGLAANYSGTISGNTIAVKLPYGVGLTSLKPHFTHTGASVSVNGVVQTSGTSAQNFSAPVNYTVTAEDSSTQAYTITLTQIVLVQDTGQIACYNGGATDTCANTAGAFPRQDADFTSLPNARSVQVQTTNAGYGADYINKDQANGLVWKSCAQGFTGAGCTGVANTVSRAAASTTCSNLDSNNAGAGFAGLHGWRLPTVMELLQLQHYQTAAVFYDTTLFINANSVQQWTTDTILPAGTNGVTISGIISTAAIGGSLNYRCVAGSAYPATQSFTDQGDGTIIDNRTSLVWQKCGVGQTNDATCSGAVSAVDWPAALSACAGLGLGGRTWRLPNTIEALTLVDYSLTTAPRVNNTYFPNVPPTGTPQPNMWTSTSAASNGAYAYVVNYSTGTTGTIDAKNANLTGTELYYARCVSGP